MLKTTKDFQLLNRYFDRMPISCLSHLSGSLCLVGLYDKKELVVWNERTDTQLVIICNDIRVLSIKRLGTTCNFIIKSDMDKVGVVTIKDIQKAEKIFSIRQLVEGSKDYES